MVEEYKHEKELASMPILERINAIDDMHQKISLYGEYIQQELGKSNEYLKKVSQDTLNAYLFHATSEHDQDINIEDLMKNGGDPDKVAESIAQYETDLTNDRDAFFRGAFNKTQEGQIIHIADPRQDAEKGNVLLAEKQGGNKWKFYEMDEQGNKGQEYKGHRTWWPDRGEFSVEQAQRHMKYEAPAEQIESQAVEPAEEETKQEEVVVKKPEVAPESVEDSGGENIENVGTKTDYSAELEKYQLKEVDRKNLLALLEKDFGSEEAGFSAIDKLEGGEFEKALGELKDKGLLDEYTEHRAQEYLKIVMKSEDPTQMAVAMVNLGQELGEGGRFADQMEDATKKAIFTFIEAEPTEGSAAGEPGPTVELGKGGMEKLIQDLKGAGTMESFIGIVEKATNIKFADMKPEQKLMWDTVYKQLHKTS